MPPADPPGEFVNRRSGNRNPSGRAANSRVGVVVGASSGIGRATASAMAAQGWTLVLAARSRESLDAAAAECRDAAPDGSISVFEMDVTDHPTIEELINETLGRYGRIDAVVHAAAVIGYGRFEDVPPEEFDRAVVTNLLGTAAVARAALRVFRAAGQGQLVLFGSLLGKIAVPFMGPYVVGKWGVHALARTLQLETRDVEKIGVSLISPGSVDTPAYLQAANRTGREGRPPPPVDPPEKVARAVVRVLEHPRRDRSVGIANGIVVAGFRMLPAVFDLLVTPLMKAAALSRRPLRPHSGNVFAPQPRGDATHGVWGRLGLRRKDSDR